MPVAAVAALWSVFRSSESLYAQALEAVHQARTFQMVVTASAEGGKGGKPQQRLLTGSYERGVGFREELPNEVAIGNSEGLWRYLKQEKLVIRSSGVGVAADVRSRYRLALRYVDFFGRLRSNANGTLSVNGLPAILQNRGSVTFTAKATF